MYTNIKNLRELYPSCGCKVNPIEEQTKYPSRLAAKITEEMIAAEDEDDSIFETLD
jgi:hypothetical protein